jgi:hypothetical protein
VVSDLVHRAWVEMEAEADARMGQPVDPVLYLARAVIAQACDEYRRGRYRLAASDCQPMPSAVRAELRQFFDSPLYRAWCDLADVDADYVRERNGVEVSGCR